MNREIQIGDIRDGDAIKGTYIAQPLPGRICLAIDGSSRGWLVDFTITRPPPTLPTNPGSSGRATVRGVKDVRVMLIEADGPDCWVSATVIPHGEKYPGDAPLDERGEYWTKGTVWHGPEDITDYVPELEGPMS